MVNPEKKSGPDITNDIKSTGRESISNNISKIKFTEEESIPDIINGIKFTGKKSISTNISNIKSSEEEFIPNITNGIKSTGEETISDIISNVKSTEEDSVLDITNGIKSTEKGSDPFINNNVKSIEHESIPYMNSDLKSLEQESVPYITNDVKSTERPVRVAIIGGGIGGLCLALGLLKYSHLDVQVYEAASTFTEIGAGVALGLNAERALESIGPAAKQAMDKHASGNLTASRSMTSFEYKIGTGENEGTLICAIKDTKGMQSVHRAHFLDELVKGIPAERAHLGKRLRELEETDAGVTLHFKDSTIATADVAIGADGVHSKVREYLIGAEAARAVFSGAVIYRGLVPMDKALEVLEIEHAQNAVMMCGPGMSALSAPVDFGKMVNVGAFVFGHKEWPHEKWVVPADHGELAAKFEGWGEHAQGVLKLLKLPTLSAWGLFDHLPAPFFHKGHVAMMGDAAHASTPFQGQGAAQAIEDACVLSALFEKVSTAQDVPNALAAYDQVRRPRAQRVVSTSREAGELMSMEYPGIGGDVEKMRGKFDTRMNWIWNRDMKAQNEYAVQLFQEAF